MKVKRLRQIEVVTDVRCDVCGYSTVMAEGYSVCCKPLGAMARLMMANSTKLSYVGLVSSTPWPSYVGVAKSILCFLMSRTGIFRILVW